MNTIDLTDEQWAIIDSLIPKRTSKRGRPRSDNRQTLNGILYVLKTGCAWEDLPIQYGSYTTCWRRVHEWSRDGTWSRIWRAYLRMLDAQERREWAQAFLDGNFVPIRQRTAYRSLRDRPTKPILES